MGLLRVCCLAVSLFMLLPGISHASNGVQTEKGAFPRLAGKYGAWKVYEGRESGEKIAWMVTYPIKQKGEAANRGSTYFIITCRQNNNSVDTITHHAGYRFASNEKVKLVISGKKDQKVFELFTEKDAAWAPDEKTDTEIVQTIKSWGTEMTASGQSNKKVSTLDTYDLNGASKAWEAMKKLFIRN